MAVQLVGIVKKFVGLAIDVKPTDCASGSEYYEYDTGLTYVYNGTAWSIK